MHKALVKMTKQKQTKRKTQERGLHRTRQHCGVKSRPDDRKGNGSPRQRENGGMDGHPQRGIKKVIVTTWHHVQEKGSEGFVHSGHSDRSLEHEGAGLLAASFGTRQLGLRECVLVSGSGGLRRLRPIACRSWWCSNSTGAFPDR